MDYGYMGPEDRKTFTAGLITGILLTVFVIGVFAQGEELCSREVREAGQRAVYNGE